MDGTENKTGEQITNTENHGSFETNQLTTARLGEFKILQKSKALSGYGHAYAFTATKKRSFVVLRRVRHPLKRKDAIIL